MRKIVTRKEKRKIGGSLNASEKKKEKRKIELIKTHLSQLNDLITFEILNQLSKVKESMSNPCISK